MGATLYALLTGRAPFPGPSSFQIFYDTMNKPHQSVSHWRTDVSSGTSSIIDTCLSKDPKDRYTDCSALLEDLQYCRNVLEATGCGVNPPQTIEENVDSKIDMFGFSNKVGLETRKVMTV
jgi:serine/threonine protein kinase